MRYRPLDWTMPAGLSIQTGSPRAALCTSMAGPCSGFVPLATLCDHHMLDVRMGSVIKGEAASQLRTTCTSMVSISLFGLA